MSDKIAVYKAIVEVQGDLAKEGIAKDRTCTQGATYKFRGIDDIYNALAPFLSKHGLCILPRILKRDCVERISKAGTALFYTTVEAEFDFVAVADGSMHTIRTFGEAMDSGDKGTNKAMSAAYKYAAFQAFCIPTEGDNDTENTTHEVKPKSASHPQNNSADDIYYERIKTALHTLYGDDTEKKKHRIIDLTTWEKDGKVIQGNPDYRKKTGKAIEILCKKLEALVPDDLPVIQQEETPF